MQHYRPILTLTTDFGLADEYVASMKGVLLQYCPFATIVDISHTIPPQDIQTASFLLQRSTTYFPAGTVHVVVVDPGVGTDRTILAVECGNQSFIAPDNGVLSHVLSHRDAAVYSVDCPDLYLAMVSSTFHGRDIMAPIAARLATGVVTINQVGNQLQAGEYTIRAVPRPVIDHTSVTGEIIHVDHFGNLCTNIAKTDLDPLLKHGNVTISIGKTSIDGLDTTYMSAGQSQALAHFDSMQALEISVNQGSAAQQLQVARGARVVVRLKTQTTP